MAAPQGHLDPRETIGRTCTASKSAENVGIGSGQTSCGRKLAATKRGIHALRHPRLSCGSARHVLDSGGGPGGEGPPPSVPWPIERKVPPRANGHVVRRRKGR